MLKCMYSVLRAWQILLFVIIGIVREVAVMQASYQTSLLREHLNLVRLSVFISIIYLILILACFSVFFFFLLLFIFQ